MTKSSSRSETADREKRAAQRRERIIDRAENTQNDDLEQALEGSFPASDPVSMTQPETGIGAPGADRGSGAQNDDAGPQPERGAAASRGRARHSAKARIPR